MRIGDKVWRGSRAVFGHHVLPRTSGCSAGGRCKSRAGRNRRAKRAARHSCGNGSPSRASIFRQVSRVRGGHAEFAELLDESRAAQVQKTGGVRDGAVGTRAAPARRAAFDGEQMRAQVQAPGWQLREGRLYRLRTPSARAVALGVRRGCGSRAAARSLRAKLSSPARSERCESVKAPSTVGRSAETTVPVSPSLGRYFGGGRATSTIRPATDDRQPLDEVAELAHVAGPRVAGEGGERCVRKLQAAAAFGAVVARRSRA